MTGTTAVDEVGTCGTGARLGVGLGLTGVCISCVNSGGSGRLLEPVAANHFTRCWWLTQ